VDAAAGRASGVLDFARQVIAPLRHQLMRDGTSRPRLRLGGGEIVWEEARRAVMCIARVKPLLPDIKDNFTDDNGNFAGLENPARGASR